MIPAQRDLPHSPSRFAVLAAVVLGGLLAVLLVLTGTSAASASATPTPSPTATGTQYTVAGKIANDDDPVEGVQVQIEGDGFSEVGTTDADGRWSVALPGPGAYTAELLVDTLPDGVEPRDPENVTRQLTIGTTSTVNVLFPLGESTATRVSFFDQFLTRLVFGLNFGLLLALAAIGISLIFGTTGVNNFAHGEMISFGGLFFYLFLSLLDWPLWIALIATLVLAAAAGWVQDALLFRPMRRRGVKLVQVMIVTIGLSILVRYLYLFAFGGGTNSLNTGLVQTFAVGPVRLTLASYASMAVSILILILVGLFLTRTRIGKATRAVSDNAPLAAASGINVDRIIRIVWVIAAVLTGLSGVLYGIFRGVSWDMGFVILLLLFAAVTLGGFGSAFGALIGALVIGLFSELSTLFVPADLRYAGALIILILVLLIRPQGLLGRRERIG